MLVYVGACSPRTIGGNRIDTLCGHEVDVGTHLS